MEMFSKMEVLERLKSGVITAEEALGEMESETREESVEMTVDGVVVKGRKIRIHVYDPEAGKRFNVNVPFALAKFAIRCSGMFSRDMKQRVSGQKLEVWIRQAMDELRDNGPETLVNIEQDDGTVVRIEVL